MSFGPTNSPITLTLPPGKTCQWTMTVQAGYVQQLVITDGAGKVVVDSKGNGTPIKFVGQGVFTAQANPYTVKILANGKPESVTYSSTACIVQGTVTEETYVFAAEDAGDGDYNDTFATLTWFSRTG